MLSMESQELPKEIYSIYNNFKGGVVTVTEIEHATRNDDFLPSPTIDLDLDCLYPDEVEKLIEDDHVINKLLLLKPSTRLEAELRARNIRVRRTAIVLSLIAFSDVSITKIA